MSKLTVLVIANNEEQIMPYFLRHYEQCADKIIVYDNLSTDGTKAILQSHPLVDYRIYDYPSFDDGDAVNFINQASANAESDWQIVVDADEFVWPAPRLREYLEMFDRDGVTLPFVQGYTMIAPEFPEICDGCQMTDCIKTGVPDEVYSKRVLFKSSVMRINYTIGKHNCLPTGSVTRGGDVGLKLLHYRYFGPEWHKARNKRNFTRLSGRAYQQGWGWHVRPENTEGKYSLNWYRTQKADQVIP